MARCGTSPLGVRQPVRLLCIDPDRRLTDHQPTAWKQWGALQPLSNPLDPRGTAPHAEGYIRTNRKADFTKRFERQFRAVHPIQRMQSNGRICASTGQTCLGGNPLFDLDRKIRPLPDHPEERLRCTVHRVFLSARHIRPPAGHGKPIAPLPQGEDVA